VESALLKLEVNEGEVALKVRHVSHNLIMLADTQSPGTITAHQLETDVCDLFKLKESIFGKEQRHSDHTTAPDPQNGITKTSFEYSKRAMMGCDVSCVGW
jgi:hypothetical protein